ncbi:hypothetical protein [Luteolibacter sp. Populi]|uniref:hypothetical protein n=1 Tax=Luteolibacter sp. Populi TaxID=3230487 RepID=UPI0034679B67
MKTLLLGAFALCAMFTPAHAVEPLKKKPKPTVLYGDWAPGKTFTYTVSEVTSEATSMGGSPQPVPVPKGIPSYRVGDVVKFTIGKKGELLGPKGLKIAFKAGSLTSNHYINLPKRKAPTPHFAFVEKNTTTTEPEGGVALTFFQVKLGKRGAGATSTVVNYSLN